MRSNEASALSWTWSIAGLALFAGTSGAVAEPGAGAVDKGEPTDRAVKRAAIVEAATSEPTDEPRYEAVSVLGDRTPIITGGSPTPRGTDGGFQLVTDQAGVTHLHNVMEGLTTGAAQIHSGGVVAADLNSDGWDDLFVLGGGEAPDRMFVNNGDGTFTDRAEAWGLRRFHHSYGASAGDFDGDGDLDLYVTSYGPSDQEAAVGFHMLLRNDGALGSNDRGFVDIAPQTGLHILQPNLKDGTGSGWGDYDLDGDLDLYVCSYRSSAYGNRLFRNDGSDGADGWVFTDVTSAAGVRINRVQGFLPRFGDLNGDRYPDLMIIGDTGSAQYFVNDGDGTFSNRTATARGVEAANSMGVDVADVDNDGLLDWYVTSIAYPGVGNVMMMQNPDGSFDDRAQAMHVQDGYWGWGAVMVDIDHDDDIDVIATNGGIGGFIGTQSVMFINPGDGTPFTEEAIERGFEHYAAGKGLVRLDIENDGDLDLVIASNRAELALFRNDLITPGEPVPSNANWIRVKLDTSARDTLAPEGTGARVRIFADGINRIVPVDNATTYCGTSPTEAHAGLGTNTVIDVLRIEWADGTHTTLTDVPANQILTVRATFHPADLDNSGEVNPDDLGVLVDRLLARDLSADLNGDGAANFFDLGLFLEQFNDAHD